MYMSEEHNIATEKYEPIPSVTMVASSIMGTRKYQQDSYACIETPMGDLAVVCDGMGGLEGGERASGLGIQTLLEDYIRLTDPDVRSFLYREVVKIDDMVAHISDETGRPIGAGSTIVAVHIKDGVMHWVSVGDSKIYVVRGGTMQCIVREHNYRLMLNEMYINGKLTLEQYRSEESKAEALISFLGIGGVSLVDLSEAPVQLMPGDQILLCSDGLYKSLSDERILAILTDNYFDLQRAADELTAAALRYAGRGQDNTTVVLVRYG